MHNCFIHLWDAVEYWSEHRTLNPKQRFLFEFVLRTSDPQSLIPPAAVLKLMQFCSLSTREPEFKSNIAAVSKPHITPVHSAV